MFYPNSIQNLINEFNKLPGIGTKTSQRFVFYLLKQNKTEIEKLTKALEHLKDEIKICSICKCFTSQDPCPICRNTQRDKTILCVVSETTDMVMIESTGEYSGLYHILGGMINTLDGVTPDLLNIKSLIERIKSENFTEIILAFDPTIEGESTVMYLKKILEPHKINPMPLMRNSESNNIFQNVADIGDKNLSPERCEVKITRLARGLPMGSDIEYADEITLSNALKGRNNA